MRDVIAEILYGIDQVNTNDETPWGWWSDTLAAEFGAAKLAQIQELFNELNTVGAKVGDTIPCTCGLQNTSRNDTDLRTGEVGSSSTERGTVESVEPGWAVASK